MSILKPLNVWSRSDEEIGRLMSNFAHTPFALDGVAYASVEGFYNMLKYVDERMRTKVAGLWGVRAKKLGSRSKRTKFRYGDAWLNFGSEKHFALVKRALSAKLAMHPGIARAFVATRPRPIVHDTGYPEKANGDFPHAVFVRLLTELREEVAGMN